jgi:hyperosmotically inducible periplasmic protein
MKAAIGSVAVAAALFVAGQVPMRAAASQASATTTAKSSTADLDSTIEKRIHDSSLKKYDIKVSVNDGVATLRGTVPTEADRRKAAELATIGGISRVDNQLVVDMNAANDVKDKAKGTAGSAESKVERNVDKGAEKTKAGVDKAIDKSADGIGTAAAKTKEGAETAWEKSKDGAEVAWVKTKEGTAKVADKSAQGVAKAGEGIAKAGEAITDTFLKTRIKSKFVDEDLLKDSDISVDVNDHVVVLTGTVPSEAGRARAIAETQKVDGVNKIIDRMTIGPKREK